MTCGTKVNHKIIDDIQPKIASLNHNSEVFKIKRPNFLETNLIDINEKVDAMRERKNPDLRVHIPSYPSDYVEMPPATRKRIEDVLRSSTPCIEDGTPGKSNSDGIRDGTRTPEVRIAGQEEGEKNDGHRKEVEEEGSPVEYRDKEKRKEGVKSITLNVSFIIFLIQCL